MENFAGDLEYHPRRAVLYFALAVAAFCFWIFSPSNTQFTAVPLVFALGGVALLIKGIFLMRKSSEVSGYRTNNSLSFPTQRIARCFRQFWHKPVKSFRTSARARFFFGLFSISAGTSTNHGATLRCSEYLSPAQFFSWLAGSLAVLSPPKADNPFHEKADPCQEFFLLFP